MTQQTVEVEKPGYIKTQLGWIPEDWEVKKFEEVFSFHPTYSYSRANLKQTRPNYLDVFNIHYGDIHAKYKQEILDFQNEKSALKIIENGTKFQPENFLIDGDLIIADASEDYKGVCDSIEIQGISNFKVVGGLHTFVARDDTNSTIKGFRSYLLKNPLIKSNILRLATGISVYGVSKTNLAKVLILIPPMQEQYIISGLLQKWDNAIKNLSKLITLKEQQKKGLMQQLLTGKKRLPGFSGEWKEYRLKDIANRVNRKNKELDDTVVTISAQRGFVKQEHFFKKRVASTTLENYTLVHKGEYAYNKSYSKGYPMGAFKRLDDFEKAVVTTLYICFQIKDNVQNDFIKHYFDSGRMIQGLMRIAQEGGRAHGLLNIGLEDFFNLKLFLPEKKEQIAISKVLNAVDKEIELVKKKKHMLQNQKKGLMQQLLTGKKRVTN